MDIKKLAGAVAATTFMFSVGAIAPASAADSQAFGIQQAVTDPNGGRSPIPSQNFFRAATPSPTRSPASCTK